MAHVCLGKVAKDEYRQLIRAEDDRRTLLVIDVAYKAGAKSVRLRSSAILNNTTDTSLEVTYSTDLGDVNTTIAAKTELCRMGYVWLRFTVTNWLYVMHYSLALPLNVRSGTMVKVRVDSRYEWAEQLQLLVPPEGEGQRVAKVLAA